MAGNPQGGDIVRLEYYFDADPGFGQGVEVSVAAAPELDQVTFPVDINSLSDGLHQLHLRSKDIHGRWSSSTPFIFVKNPLPTQSNDLPALTDIEYFFDNDPGFGNGTAVVFTPGMSVENLNVPLDISGLTDGLHQLTIRAGAADGAWSWSNSYFFLKGSLPAFPSPIVPDLVRLEYFFDADPGFGQGVSQVVSGTNLSGLLLPLDIGALQQGLHTVNVRLQDADGNWSHAAPKVFFRGTLPYQSPDPGARIVALEYFFNRDTTAGAGVLVPCRSRRTSRISSLKLAAIICCRAPTRSIFARKTRRDGGLLPWASRILIHTTT
ncbi:MAG: hypothetical protein IPM98_15665 [Lewinellaceae bacterium]|nr:hypothetical protein [Lewinellaceae bacterium]